MCVLLLVLSQVAAANLPASTSVSDEHAFAEKIRKKLTELGPNPKCLIYIKLRNGKKVIGYVSEIRNSSVVVTAGASTEPTTVNYRDIARIKGKKRLSENSKWGIGMLAVFVLWAIVWTGP
jgi:hypothetical protein